MNPEAGRHGDGDGRHRDARTLDHRVIIAVLFAAGLLVSGFTILRQVEPFDEGLTLNAARRVAQGQVPYRDFLWAYGPAHLYLLAGLFKAFGTSLLWWRIVRVLVDAAVALVVFLIVRREAPFRVALVAWLVAICAMAQPTGANPFAPALLFSLGAVWCAARGEGRRALIASGLLCVLAGAWRIDFGVYAAVAALAAAFIRTPPFMVPVLGAAAVGTAVVYLPVVITDGPADAWRDLIGRSLNQGHYWHLPFPLGYDGRFRLWPPGSFAHDAKDVLGFYVPLILVIGIAVAVVAIARRRLHRDALIVGLTVLALTALAYLLSRTDEFHATPLIVVLATLLPLIALRLSARGAAVLAVVVLALLAYGASNRLSALFGPPALATIHIPVADGVKAPPAQARAIEQMVHAVQQRVPAADPIYTVTRRSDLVRINNPLIYVLTERDNPTRQDFGIQTGGPAQQEIVNALEAAKPKAIVRWLSRESTVREPNDRGKPTGIHTLDRWLAARYRAAARYGDYQILVPR